MKQIITINYREPLPIGYEEINVTSRGKDEYRNLSPFMESNVHCYKDLYAKNVENAWQFSKVYTEHVSKIIHKKMKLNPPNQKWTEWRNKGFQDSYAHRYPMGKWAIPLYSWWDSQGYDYIEARKEIYFPLYIRSLTNNKTLDKLKEKVKNGDCLAIRDFDVYRFDIWEMSLIDVVNQDLRKAGHGFAIYHILTGENYK